MHTITQAHPSTLGSGIHMAKTTLSQQYFYSLYTVMKVAHLQFQQSHISDKKKKKRTKYQVKETSGHNHRVTATLS